MTPKILFSGKRTAVDIDGVLANFDSAWCDAANKMFGLELCPPATDWDFVKSYGMTPEQVKELWEADLLMEYVERARSYSKGRYYSSLVGPGSFYVTARGANLNLRNAVLYRQITLSWLVNHGMPDLPIAFTDQKVQFCDDHGLEYAIDDAPHHVEAYIEANIPVLMPVYPYNDHIDHPLVTRMEGWR